MSTDRPPHAESSHYFAPNPLTPSNQADFEVKGPWGTLHMASEAGVFSSRGLDKGTDVLLRTVTRAPVTEPEHGELACDLGCGSGVLACVLALTHPGWKIHAVDINERARELTGRNAERNGLDNVEVLPGTQPPAGSKYHLIWSNPPIRIGKEALHELLALWLGHLHEDGVAVLVVARNLGADSLAAWLGERGFAVRRISSSRGFRVLEVRPRLDGETDQ